MNFNTDNGFPLINATNLGLFTKTDNNNTKWLSKLFRENEDFFIT